VTRFHPGGGRASPASRPRRSAGSEEDIIFSTALCITFREALLSMTQAVSVRLDDEVQRALRTLEASGMNRSEAIRKSILDAASALRRREVLRTEVAALEADQSDRREMQKVASLMEGLRAEG